MIIGQLVGGTLGDILGRHRAMAAVMFLQVFAALASAFSMPISISLLGVNGSSLELSIHHVLALWRFILGLGCGGVYPLAAILTAESSQSSKDRGKSVALTFSFQGVGYLAVPIFAWLVVAVLESDQELAWRLILGVGALPGIILTALRVQKSQSRKEQPSVDETEASGTPKIHSSERASVPHHRIVPVSIVDTIRMEESLVRKMIGTGGCWLLFDVLFYGNTLFEPVVLSSAFGTAETVQNVARDTAMIAAMALPGYLVSVYAVGRQSPRWIQIQGFCVMGVLYFTVAMMFGQLAQRRTILLLVYGLTFFFSNYGPNATTFMLPSMTFSRPCRSTLNGVCAACGKVGALIGAAVFLTAARSLGQDTVFLMCSLLCFVGALMTNLCVSESVGREEEVELDIDELLLEEEFLEYPMKIVYSQPSFLDYVDKDG
jgi:PHS family inorganic phosphate transporter-like MFS transporter